MKKLKDIIASTLVELVIKSFPSAIYPGIFKIAEVIPIFKSEYNVQFDFRLSLSSHNALKSITENIQYQLDENDFSAGVFVDLKEAFDTVYHEVLLKRTVALWN